MAIEIKEYVGAKLIKVKSTPNDLANLKEGYAETYIDQDSLMVDIEAIHSRVTRNNTYYSPNCLKESVKYWTHPYERPVIMHHNEKDGKIIGRIKSVEYTESNTRSETAALIFTANIGDEEGKRGIKNGTLSTVSIGVIAHDLRCSICGTNLAEEGACEHDRGEVYDDKLCYWIIEKMEPKEVSYVIVPSDIYAHNLKVYDAIKKKKNEVKESMEYENPFADLLEATKPKTKAEVETTESKQVDEEVKKGDEPAAVKTEEVKTEEKKVEETPEQEAEKKVEEESEKKAEVATEEDKKAEKVEEETKGEEKEESEPEEEAETKEESKEELEEAKAKISELEKKIEELEKANEKLANKFENEKRLKESAESQLIEFRAEKKKDLVETINSLRSQLSLPEEDAKSLMESTEESLHMTVKSLNEFVQVSKKVFAGMQTIDSPVAVTEAKDNTVKENKKITDVKESKEESNKTLEDQYINLMESLF